MADLPLTPPGPGTYAERSGMKMEVCCRWHHSLPEVWVDTARLYATWADRVPLGKSAWLLRCLKVKEVVLSVSDKVVFSTSSSSLRPCAMCAVEAMVTTRNGWSNHETESLSVTSLSPRSRRDALEALWDLAGLTLNVPLDDVTAWRNSRYCAAETFLWDP